MNMKEILKRLSLLKILTIILVVIIIVTSVNYAQKLQLGRSNVPAIDFAPLSDAVAQISKDAGDVFITARAGKELYLNTKNLDAYIKDTQTGFEWHSIYEGDKATVNEKSPILIEFLSGSGTLTTWDAHTYSISNGEYDIERIPDGFKIYFRFRQSESTNLNEYMPQKISIERYEEIFLNKIDELLAEGKIEEITANRYKTALSLIYARDEDEGCYYNRYSGTPPVSAANLLISLSKDVGYTREMLLEDSMRYGIVVNISKPAEIDVTLEAKLDENGDFVVRIPTYETKSHVEDFTLQNIVVYPNFGLIPSKDTSNGFIFVPDGAGALIDLNSFDGRYPEYNRPVYNNTIYQTMYYQSEYKEDIMMPVFGMAGEYDGALRGFLGIIENGEELAYINAASAITEDDVSGTPFNKVYTSFDAVQFYRVKVFGEYSDNNARFLSSTGPINVDYTIRYKLFSEDATYYNMAQAYKDYLVDKYNLKQNYDKKPALYLDVIGSLTVEDRFLGIPYDKIMTMTTYKELMDIYGKLSGYDKTITYTGAVNGGMYNKVNNGIELVKQNGNKEDLKKAQELMGDDLYIGVNLLSIYSGGGGFDPGMHALIGYNGKPAEFYNYHAPSGRFDMGGIGRYILHPRYLEKLTYKFLNDAKGLNFKNFTLQDMGNTYYVNYKSGDIVTPVEGEKIIENALRAIKGQNSSIILQNPYQSRALYADILTDISRESSRYGIFKTSVPFRQIVLNGLVEYTTLNINMASSSKNYFILNAVETAARPKFTVTAQSVDKLKELNFSELFSTEFGALEEDIKYVMDEIDKAFSKIGSTKIVGHRVLDDNVFETTYEGGVKVVVNYNTFDVTTEEGAYIPGMGYVILGGQ
mgnify:CR=1 FL=1